MISISDDFLCKEGVLPETVDLTGGEGGEKSAFQLIEILQITDCIIAVHRTTHCNRWRPTCIYPP